MQKKWDFRLSDRDEALKAGTVPAKTARMVSLTIWPDYPKLTQNDVMISTAINKDIRIYKQCVQITVY